MDKKIIAILILIGILIAGSFVYAYKEYEEKKKEVYDKGFIEGQLDLYNQMIINLNQNQEIVLPVTVGNNTFPIKLIPIPM